MSEKKQASIKITEEKISPVKLKINFSIPSGELDEFIKKAANEISKDLKVDGFRKGNIPFEVVQQNVGRDKLLQEGADRAVKKYYVDYVLDNKIQAVGQPILSVKKLAKGNDFEFEAEVDILPEIKLNNWQEKIKEINKKYKDTKNETKEEEINKELEYLSEQRAKIKTVNREAKKGDQAEIDFEVFQDNVPIEGGTAKKHQVIIGKGQFIPGFEEQLIGMKADEEKEFELEFPKEYHQKHLAGKKALFRVKLNFVQEREIPEINDDFASGIGKFKNLEELKKNLREGIKQEKDKKTNQKQEMEIIDALTEDLKIEIPQVLVDSEIEKMDSELNSSIAQMGLNRQQYFQQIKTTEEKLKEQWKKKDAPKRIKAALILRDLARENKIMPKTEEIQNQLNQILQYYKTLGQAAENMDTKRLYENIKAELTNKKTFEFLRGL